MRPTRLSALIGLSAASLLLAGTGVAQATQAPAPAQPAGKVVSPNGVNARQYPSLDSSPQAVLKHRQELRLVCKVRAQRVNGNPYWFKIRGERQWVAARHVASAENVPFCKTTHPTKLSQQEQQESAIARG